eukprot:2066141-Prymnesium_polylepis.1
METRHFDWSFRPPTHSSASSGRAHASDAILRFILCFKLFVRFSVHAGHATRLLSRVEAPEAELISGHIDT